MRTRLLNLEKRLVKWRDVIIKTFQILEIAIIAIGWLGGTLIIQDYQQYHQVIFQIGQWFGSLALFFYALTLVPGILKRTQVMTEYTLPVASMITLFRRHLGISMFLLLSVHLLFVTVLPLAAQGMITQLPEQIERGQLWGFIALLMLLPLWITSNDTSAHLFGKWRDYIHKGTYIIMVFMFLHAWYMQSFWAVVLLVIGVLLVFSWFRQYRLSTAQ